MASSNQRREKLQEELVRLERLQQDLARDWKRVPYAAALFVLAAPAFYLYGVMGSSLTILTVGSLVATAYYLIGVRRAEYRREAQDIRDELTRLPSSAKGAPPPNAEPPSNAESPSNAEPPPTAESPPNAEPPSNAEPPPNAEPPSVLEQ